MIDGVPLGVQPVTEDRIQCLECGRWFRALASHLHRMHELDGDSYRAKYELTQNTALVSPDVRERLSERGLQRIAQDESVRETLYGDIARNTARLPGALKRSLETRHRAGLEHVRREAGKRGSETVKRKFSEAHDERARSAGSADMRDLLTKLRDAPASRIAAMLDIKVGQVERLRKLHGLQRKFCYLRPGREPVAGPPEVGPGVQPQTERGLVCLECGRWYASLTLHLSSKHGLTGQAYKAKHELPASIGLERETTRLNRQIEARRRTAEGDSVSRMLEAARRNDKKRVALIKARAQARYDAKASALGYRDIVHLVNETQDLSQAKLGRLLGASKRSARLVREKYLDMKEVSSKRSTP